MLHNMLFHDQELTKIFRKGHSPSAPRSLCLGHLLPIQTSRIHHWVLQWCCLQHRRRLRHLDDDLKWLLRQWPLQRQRLLLRQAPSPADPSQNIGCYWHYTSILWSVSEYSERLHFAAKRTPDFLEPNQTGSKKYGLARRVSQDGRWAEWNRSTNSLIQAALFSLSVGDSHTRTLPRYLHVWLALQLAKYWVGVISWAELIAELICDTVLNGW